MVYWFIVCYCRLEELQQNMVGGEQANNEEVKERRKKKKKYAEERRKKLLGLYIYLDMFKCYMKKILNCLFYFMPKKGIRN